MNIKKEKRINNIILAIYISIPMITKIITTFLLIENNILFLVIALLLMFFTFNIKDIKITRKFLTINLLIFFAFLISFIKVVDNKYTIHYLLNYFLYGTIGLFFMQYNYEYKKVFHYINIIFIVFTMILIIRYIPLVMTSRNLDFTMDLSYTVIIGLTATLINFKYNKYKIIKIISIICISVNLYYLVFLNNNRGSLIALLFFIGLLLIKKIKKRRNKIIVCIAGCILCVSSVNIVLNFLENMNTNINWINRLQYQIKQNNISSDRDSLYIDALKKIDENLFMGIGIGEYENSHNGFYTHNIFLQLSCENGIIWAIVICGYLLYCIYKTVILADDKEIDMFLMFLLVQFIPRLLVSSVQWLNSYIWIYIFIYLRKEDKTKNERASIEN